MTPAHYRIWLEYLGLTQNGAGRFFNVNETTARRWAADDGNGPPEPVAKLIHLMVAKGITPASADRAIGRCFAIGKVESGELEAFKAKLGGRR